MSQKEISEALVAAPFTPSQLKNWKAYERVRKSGKYNMFDPRARRATKLGPEAYSFVMQYFSELQAAVDGSKRKGGHSHES